jgi:hypothetical protein
MGALSVFNGMTERHLKTFDRKNKTTERRVEENGTGGGGREGKKW